MISEYMTVQVPEKIKEYLDIIDYLKMTLPTVLLIILAILYVLIFHLEKVNLFFAKLLSIIPSTSTKISKARISRTISANVIKATKSAHKEFDEFLPHDIEIKWANGTETTREAFIKDQKVILCIKNDYDEELVIVRAVYDFIKCSLFSKEKATLTDEVVLSSAIAMTRKFLMRAYIEGISTFFDKLVYKEIDKNDDTLNLIEKLIEIDERGFFTTVFIREVKKACIPYIGRLKNESFTLETKEFINFLFKLANRDQGEHHDLNFCKVNYKVGVIFIANTDTYVHQGVKPYVKWYDQYVLDGYSGIYLFCQGIRMFRIEKVVTEIKEKNSYISHTTHTYEVTFKDGYRTNGQCIVLNAKKVVV